jgi:hypothetical protein
MSLGNAKGWGKLSLSKPPAVAGGSAQEIEWTKFTITYEDLADASMDNTIPLTSLSDNTYVYFAIISVNTPFNGGTLTDYGVSIDFDGSVGPLSVY